MRSAASCTQPLHESSGPRGARTGRADDMAPGVDQLRGGVDRFGARARWRGDCSIAWEHAAEVASRGVPACAHRPHGRLDRAHAPPSQDATRRGPMRPLALRCTSLAFVVLGAAAAPLPLAGCADRSAPPPVARPTAVPTSGHDLVMQATRCWMGGLYSSALGETGKARQQGIDMRCDDLLASLGRTHEEAYYPLRAVEPDVVADIAWHVRDLAGASLGEAQHARALVRLLYGIADAMRETIDARRAADVVKGAAEVRAPSPERRAGEDLAAAKLLQGHALRALFHLQAEPYDGEARAVALLGALDRMEIARGLPMHLKVDAVGDAFDAVFGVSPPPVVGPASAPLPGGTWLGYLLEVATAAGHAVPADSRDPVDHEPLAWSSVLAGFADKLHADAARGTGGALAPLEQSTAARLDDEFRIERALYQARLPVER